MDIAAGEELSFPAAEKKYRPFTDEEWVIYEKKIKESEGFDAWEYPHDVMEMGIIMPYGLTEEDPDMEMLKQYSQLALDQYNNDKGTSFQLVKVLKVNWRFCQGATFYITFQADDTAIGAFENFQTKVDVYVHEITIVFVRLEPNSQSLEESGKETGLNSISSVSSTAVALKSAL